MTQSAWKRIHYLLLSMALGSTVLASPGTSVKVGDEAPDFELSDANGRMYRLSDFRGKSAVVLEFFRSGDW